MSIKPNEILVFFIDLLHLIEISKIIEKKFRSPSLELADQYILLWSKVPSCKVGSPIPRMHGIPLL